jgi:glycine dehydrogenase
MIEPTESESKEELDRFIEAMLSIRKEIEQVEQGHWDVEDNPLRQAPHSMADITGDWQRSYSREQAVFPLPWIAPNKFWPAVNRIDNVYGDRNLFCACPPLEDY